MADLSLSFISDSISSTTGGHHERKLRQKILMQQLSEASTRTKPRAGGSTARAAETSASSAVAGLVDRQDSAIKAVSSGNRMVSIPMPEAEIQPAASNQLPYPSPHGSSFGGVEPRQLHSLSGQVHERMVVLPAGGLGRAATRQNSRTPQRASSQLSNAQSGVTVTPTREVDRLHVENRAPPRFTCPISGRIMRDPVILSTGTTCDRGALERYLHKGNKRCPVTKHRLKKPIHLMPNMEMQHNIAVWASRNAPWLLTRDGFLRTNEPTAAELQGGPDRQYYTPVADEGTPGTETLSRFPSRTAINPISRIEAGKHSWRYTNGSKVRPGAPGSGNAAAYNINASAAIPWDNHRGISSAPRSIRPHRSSSRSVSPSKRQPKRDWYSTGFLALVSAAYVALFIMSLWQNAWQLAPMVENPWFGAGPEALATVGAQAAPLLETAWWRLFSSPFVTAGVIHLVAALAGLWTYGRYAQNALPLPQASIPAVYLIAAVVGSLASANLNPSYLVCGGLAGVCGLLGTLCADQMLNFNPKRLLNLREWYLVALLLIVNAGALISASLLPMVDVWSTAAALISGFFLSLALLLIPRVGAGKPRNAMWATFQALASLLVVCMVAAGAAGFALPTQLSSTQPILETASCFDFGALKCVPYGYLPDGCGISMLKDGEAALTCPAGGPAGLPLPQESVSAFGSAEQTAALCVQYCGGAVAQPPAATEAPPGALVVGGATEPASADTNTLVATVMVAGRKLRAGVRRRA